MSAAAAPAPDAWARFGQSLSERLNPIVVKEVRQGLRTRAFWIFFGLMLLACLTISMVAWATAGELTDAGQGFFIAYFVCLAVVQFFVIPYTAYRSMAREREDETWVLLTLTGLGPRRILRGKLLSFVVQGSLYASAAGPFLLFSYYLNGIDLPTIVFAVALGAAWQLFLTAMCVSIATLAESRLVRGLLHFVVLGGLLWSFGWGIGGTVALMESGRALFTDASALVAALGVLFGMVSFAALLFEAAAARLSLSTESYARGPRTVFVAQVFGALALVLWGWDLEGRPPQMLLVAQMLACGYFAVVGLFVASDLDGMGRNHWASSFRLQLFKPGALRGYLLVLLCLAAVSAVLVGLYPRSGDERLAMLAAPAFVALYLSAPMVLTRWLPHHPSQTPVLVRVVFLALLMIGTGVPPLAAAIAGKDPIDPGFNLLNPVLAVVSLGEHKSSGPHLTVVLAASAVAVLLTLGSLLKRDVRPSDLSLKKAGAP